MTPNPDYIRALKESVLTAPYPALIGMSLDAIDFDSCAIGVTLGEKHLQPFGIIHGGVLATLIDTATFWAGFLRLPDDVGLVNVDRSQAQLPEGGVEGKAARRRQVPACRSRHQLYRSQRV